MGWTYSGNPGDNPRDLARFLLGDRTETPQSLTDEEMDWLLAQHPGNTYHAAAEAAGILHTRYIGLSATMKRVGDLTLQTSYAEQAGAYLALEARLMRGRTVYFPGAPVTADTSEAVFSIGMTDQAATNPRHL